MRFAVFVLIAIALCLVQYSLLARCWWLPDLPLALAAWAMVDGPEEGVLPRVMAVGVLQDAAEPGSSCFHLVAYVLLALGMLVLRDFLFRTRTLAWALSAAAVSLLATLMDCLVSGAGDVLPWRLWIMALGAAGACIALGWLLGGLPQRLRPVARAGA